MGRTAASPNLGRDHHPHCYSLFMAGAGVKKGITYGASDEFHQRFVPGRSADLLDLRADALGAAAAIGVAWLSGILLRSRRAGGASPRVL